MTRADVAVAYLDAYDLVTRLKGWRSDRRRVILIRIAARIWEHFLTGVVDANNAG